MRAIRKSGLMSGDGKRGDAQASVLAPILDSTKRTANARFEARKFMKVMISRDQPWNHLIER